MFFCKVTVCVCKIIVWGKHWSSSDIAFSGQKKAVVIRHLYNEDGVSNSDSTLSAMTDVNEAFAVSDLKDTEIKIPEEKVPEIESEQQVRIWDVFSRCQYFLFRCTWLLRHLNFGISLAFWIINYGTLSLLPLLKNQ